MTHPGAADPRLDLLHAWIATLPAALQLDAGSLRPASADASFRRYFRIDGGGDYASLILMDAPPEREALAPFVQVAQLLHAAGVNAPRILARDDTQGFLLLTDLGTTTYLAALTDARQRGDAGRAHALMMGAIDTLVRWQHTSRAGVLPPYDAALLRRELELFPDWYIARHLGYTLSDTQRATLMQLFDRIIAANLDQAQVYVHRDYMPRNLMVGASDPGVLDFQDAVFGPISYDIASLPRDAFISWDEAQVIDWTARYWEQARASGLPVPADFGRFWRDVEWMGVQRHLKVLGIFARINYRDGKPRYLTDTPRFVAYVRAAARRYDALAPLARLFDELEGVAQRAALTF
jgi:aminoglycoside/choline kinase family phosphotransferase